jgi:STE24 endopeptidase
MSADSILTIILSITIAGFIFEQLLEYINLTAQRSDIPPEISSFYNRDKYITSLEYHKESTRFGFVTSAFGFLLSMTMLSLGGFGWFDNFLSGFIDNEILRALVFFGVLAFAGDILTMPFQWYSTFVIEEKYGFNKTTYRTFLLDKVKGYLLGAVIGGGLLSLLIYLITLLGENFWIWFALAAGSFILVVNMFYTTLILPLFNQLTPLPEGELKQAIEEFSKRVNFPLENVFVIDGSKRSKKANAFFSGIGRRKKIVLYDTLIANHSIEELVAVLAHEVGHFKKKHIIQSYILSLLQIVFMLFILSKIVFDENVSQALGANGLSIPVNLLAFGILFSPISSITGLFMTILSRKNEFEADSYARKHYNADALSHALKKLSVDNLSNLYPHPLYVFFYYSHPPLLQRLEALSRPAFPK